MTLFVHRNIVKIEVEREIVVFLCVDAKHGESNKNRTQNCAFSSYYYYYRYAINPIVEITFKSHMLQAFYTL